MAPIKDESVVMTEDFHRKWKLGRHRPRWHGDQRRQKVEDAADEREANGPEGVLRGVGGDGARDAAQELPDGNTTVRQTMLKNNVTNH
jgi:hypothetical protein